MTLTPSTRPPLSAQSVPDIQVFTRRHVGLDDLEYDETSNVSYESEEWDDESTEMMEESYAPIWTEEPVVYGGWFGRICFWGVSISCVVGMLAMALFHIWSHGQATRMGFTYSQLSKQTERLKEEHRLIKLQLEKLRNPARLAKIARQQLGMRLPDRRQILSEEMVQELLQAPSESSSKSQVHLASGKSKLVLQ